MKLYDIFKGEDLAIAEKIQQRRLQMIIHSCIYYTMNDSIVTDHQWAEWAHELVYLQTRYPEIANRVPLGEYFDKDWDGSTGMDLPITADWVVGIAKKLLEIRDRKGEIK